MPICIKCLLDDGFDIVVDVDKLFTYDIYLVIYPMSCLPVSKIYGMLGGLLMSGLVVVEVMLILVSVVFTLLMSPSAIIHWVNWSLDYE